MPSITLPYRLHVVSDHCTNKRIHFARYRRTCAPRPLRSGALATAATAAHARDLSDVTLIDGQTNPLKRGE